MERWSGVEGVRGSVRTETLQLECRDGEWIELLIDEGMGGNAGTGYPHSQLILGFNRPVAGRSSSILPAASPLVPPRLTNQESWQ
ncbi:hypothetical protein BT69DRAFT_1282501 [Atractiella rhizophila]|nr:hypothetical protein BT69DRAFT_1282501 [Atractiella rhizophila]